MDYAVYLEQIKSIQVKFQQSYDSISEAFKIISAATAQLGSASVQLENLKRCIINDQSDVGLTDLPKPKIVKVESAPVIEVVEEPLVINDEWKATLDILNNSHENVFVTGGAGTGKSRLLQYFQENYDGTVAVTAPTGVAAYRVGGETVHRFFGFKAHALERDDIPEHADNRKDKYKAVSILIIDEISMVRADLMDAIDQFMRLNGRDKNKPFGGCRVIMFGDLFQLPPVSKEKDEKKWLIQRYGTDTPYFFHAEVWRNAPLKTCVLNTIFRQKDPTFTDALNAIRTGTMTDDHIKLINTRVDPFFKSTTDDLWLTLTTTNAVAEESNQRMLKALNTTSEIYKADVSGDFDLKNAPVDGELTLKVGANVMFVKNKAGKWVNGTLGKVVSINPLQVEAKGVKHDVEAETWEDITYEFDEKKKKLTKRVKGMLKQVPLKLAAAITIHKSQGLTLDNCIVDFGNGAFAPGQAYVALSRCKSLKGMVLRHKLHDKDLIISTEVQKFLRGESIAKPQTAQPSFVFDEPKPATEVDAVWEKLKASENDLFEDKPYEPSDAVAGDVTKLF